MHPRVIPTVSRIHNYINTPDFPTESQEQSKQKPFDGCGIILLREPCRGLRIYRAISDRRVGTVRTCTGIGQRKPGKTGLEHRRLQDSAICLAQKFLFLFPRKNQRMYHIGGALPGIVRRQITDTALHRNTGLCQKTTINRWNASFTNGFIIRLG